MSEITNDEIRHADWINAVDPNSGHYETLWGIEVAETTSRRETAVLDVEVTSGDKVGLLKLIERIEAVRGRLSARVQILRENLQIASVMRTAVYSDEDAVRNDLFHG